MSDGEILEGMVERTRRIIFREGGVERFMEKWTSFDSWMNYQLPRSTEPGMWKDELDKRYFEGLAKGMRRIAKTRTFRHAVAGLLGLY